jgi:AcrR family transcriptional regulator
MSAQDTQDRIVEQAAELFLRYGVRSVTMDDLAHHLSISKKTIYQFFKDKKDVVKTCVGHILAREFSDFEAIKRNSRDVMEEVLLLSDHLRRMLRHMNPGLLFDLKKYYPEAWEMYQQQKQECHLGNIREALERGQREGLVRSDIDIDIVAKHRMESVEMGFNPQIFPSDRYDLTTVQLQLFDLFVHAIATPQGLEAMRRYASERGQAPSE